MADCKPIRLSNPSQSKKYAGKWVALRSFRGKKIIASGKAPSIVIEKARKKGIKDPVVFFIDDIETHIYKGA